MKKILEISLFLILFGTGIYLIKGNLDENEIKESTENVQKKEEREPKLELQAVVMRNEDSDFLEPTPEGNFLYQGEFPFNRMNPEKEYSFILEFVDKDKNLLKTKKNQPLSITKKLNLYEEHGTIRFFLSGNQPLIKELEQTEAHIQILLKSSEE